MSKDLLDLDCGSKHVGITNSNFLKTFDTVIFSNIR